MKMASATFPISIILALGFLLSRSFAVDKLQCTNAPMYRLPETLVPTLYNISLTVYPNGTKFVGSVRLWFDLLDQLSSEKSIYLHVDNEYIFIESVKLNDILDCPIYSPNEADILEINCTMDIIGKDNFLDVEYAGKFSEDGHGLVKNVYMDQGVEQIAVESYFKPTYARRCFPSMDEPSFKANFSLKLTYPSEYTVLSDTPVAEETTDDTTNMKTTLFSTTPKISPYLLSIFMSKLETAGKISDELQLDFQIFTRASAVNLTAKVVGQYHSSIYDTLGHYIGIEYQNLSDTESYHVAVPDYYSDAMGGFGLFTYRETDILDEGDKTTSRVTQDILTTMTYKLSHEWFGGNIATKWWSDVWANEAVATYFKYIVADQVDSGFDLYNQFVVEVVQNAMQYDALPSAKPLSSKDDDVAVREDIRNKLDTISYQKGASILHMIRYILKTENDFQSSLQNHWKKRNYSNTDGASLITDLVGSHEDYNTYLQEWVFEPGFPLLTITITKDTNTTEVVSLTQKRFIYPVEGAAKDETQWYIPLTACISTNENFEVFVEEFLEPSQDSMYFHGNDSWIMFNMQGRLFYRVNYDETLWNRLIDSLMDDDQRPTIHVLNRAQMIDDIFNIARIGDVRYELAFDLANYLSRETEYYPWYSAFNAFKYLLGKMENEGIEENLKAFIHSKVMFVVEFPDDPYNGTHIDMLKDVMILEWACNLGISACVQDAIIKFGMYKEDPASLENYNLRGVMLCAGLRHSENILEDFETLWNMYSSSLSVHEQSDILNALGCVENKNLLEWYLYKIVTPDSGLKRQDVLLVFKSVFSSNSLGLQAAMEFLEAHLDTIYTLYKDIDMLSEMIYVLAEKLVTDEHLQWLKNLVANEILDTYKDIRTKAITLVSVNNYWAHHYRSQLTDLFQVTTISTSDGSTTKYTSTTTTTTTEAPTTSPSTSSSTEEGTTVPSSTTESRSEALSLSKSCLTVLLIYCFILF